MLPGRSSRARGRGRSGEAIFAVLPERGAEWSLHDAHGSSRGNSRDTRRSSAAGRATNSAARQNEGQCRPRERCPGVHPTRDSHSGSKKSCQRAAVVQRSHLRSGAKRKTACGQPLARSSRMYIRSQSQRSEAARGAGCSFPRGVECVRDSDVLPRNVGEQPPSG